MRQELEVLAGDELIGAGPSPAAQVADRTSRIRITGLRLRWVNPVVFVQITTNHDVSGGGDIKAIEPHAAMALAESLFALLDGENPTRIEYLWQKIYRAHRDMRGGPMMVHTLAGLDIALWDLTGKLWGVPIYRLLGGPTRERIRGYHRAKARKGPNPGRFEHNSKPADLDAVVA